jgi:hypothetical protein
MYFRVFELCSSGACPVCGLLPPQASYRFNPERNHDTGACRHLGKKPMPASAYKDAMTDTAVKKVMTDGAVKRP